MSKVKSAAALAAGPVIACCVAFTPIWEGMDPVAKRDAIGTGHPVTYCYGQTAEFGDVKVGTRFTKSECDEKLAESLPRYLEQIERCIHVDLPDKTMASLLDASYNAGPAAVCRSPMVAKMNTGELEAGCKAFKGWYVRSDGQVRKGLVARRSGIDSRKSEEQLCLEGLSDAAPAVDAPAPIPKPPKYITTDCGIPGMIDCTPKPKPKLHRHAPKPKPVVERPWYWWMLK